MTDKDRLQMLKALDEFLCEDDYEFDESDYQV